MTYNVLMETLNPTHSLTHSLTPASSVIPAVAGPKHATLPLHWSILPKNVLQ